MPTRRLAAILFADIVGYTAMMQADEAVGIARAYHLRKAIEDLLPQHGGELIEMRGDGAFCLFASSTDAVRCALKIQQAVNEEVPLRIGTHLGDITQQEGHIFGDAVNIASRVESMGVAGSVLLSHPIRQQIKNKPEFELESLGSFAFKNVAEPMDIYALANEGLIVPKLQQMQGKGEKVQEEKPSVRNWLRMASIGFVAMAAGAVLFWGIGGQAPNQTTLLPKSIRAEKVAVAIQNNHTGEEKLDALGFLASEWLTSSLREIGVRTVSSDMVRQYSDYVNVLQNDPEGRPSFSDITGAQYVLEGSYYLSGRNKDSIRFHLRLNSAETGEQIQIFPAIYGEKRDEEGLVEKVRQRLLGYWAMREDFPLPSVNPPNYEAYQAFLKCPPGDFPCHLEAVALDSTFLLARCFLLQSAALYDQDSIYQVNSAYIQRNWASCTAYEKNLYSFVTAAQARDYPAAFEAIDANFHMDSTDILAIHESGINAWLMLNRPDICAERFGRLFDQMDVYKEKIWSMNLTHFTEVLNHLERPQEVVDFAERFALSDWFSKTTKGSARTQLLKANIAMGQTEKAFAYGEGWYQYNQRGPLDFSFFSRAATIYATSFPADPNNPFIPGLQALLGQLRPSDSVNYKFFWGFGIATNHPAWVYYLLHNWPEAEGIVINMKKYEWEKIFRKYQYGHFESNAVTSIYPHYAKMEVEGFLGCIYARQGRRKEALEQIQVLEELIQKKPSTRNRWLFGKGPYLKARIYAVLGEKAAAVEQLNIGRNAGLLQNQKFRFDLDLSSLRGFGSYEELMLPKK